MDKLYYIVCEDNETTLFEGRYQGRTRGAALKFLKQSLGRKSLNGLVFTITEIPVPIIREIVAEILAGGDGMEAASNVGPMTRPEPEAEEKVERFDAYAEAPEPDSPPADSPAPEQPKPDDGPKVGNPGHGEEAGGGHTAFLSKRLRTGLRLAQVEIDDAGEVQIHR